MKRITIMLTLIIVSALSLNAQRRNNNYNINKALPWVVGNLPDDSDDVRYKVAYGEGTTYQMARKMLQLH